jgi:hypothetical protein
MQWSFSLNNFGVHLSLQSWRWCLRCCSVVVSSKGTHKVEQHCTKKKPTKCPKFKCNTVSVSFSACRCSSVVFSSKVAREKKRVCRQVCEWYLRLWLACPLMSACCCCRHYLCRSLWGELSNHLAPQALFTQSSPVHEPLLQAFSFPSTGFLWPLCLFTAHMGSASSLLSCGVFLPPPFSQTFLLLVAGRIPPLPPEPLRPGLACLFTAPGRIPLTPSSVLSMPHSLCNVSLLFLLLITQFLFFPQVEVGLSRGLCCSGQGCLFEYHLPLSSSCPLLPSHLGTGNW